VGSGDLLEGVLALDDRPEIAAPTRSVTARRCSSVAASELKSIFLSARTSCPAAVTAANFTLIG
jgi:hypothetical protein